MNHYEWHVPGPVKADVAIMELQRIEFLQGSITPQSIVDAARPEKSAFHKLFTWEDSPAAEHTRLQEASKIMRLITISVIRDGERESVPI